MLLKYYVLFLIFGKSLGETCLSDEFACANGERCLSKAFVCDGTPNCGDSSDEDQKLCEDWVYEYEDNADEYDEDGGGGGWFGWGGGDNDYEETKEEDYDYEDSEDTKVEEIEYDDKFKNQKCSMKKCEVRGPLKWEEEKEYVFSYVWTSKIDAVRRDENQTTSVQVSCDVVIQTLTSCEMYMKIKNIETKSTKPWSDSEMVDLESDLNFLKNLAKEPLRFSMLGGQIDSICPSNAEDVKSVNFKRGVISMLQNTMPRLDLPHTQTEKDLMGSCSVQYSYDGFLNRRIVVSKTKDILSCSNKNQVFSLFKGVSSYNSQGSILNNLLKTDSSCVQEIRSGIIQKVKCAEYFNLDMFEPIGSENGDNGNGIISTTTQELEYKSEDSFSTKWRPVENRQEISFDKSSLSNDFYFENADTHTVDYILEKLADFKTMTENGDVDHPSKLFNQLVDALKSFSFDQIRSLNSERKWKIIDRKYFQDAISMVGTASSVKFIAHELGLAKSSNRDVFPSWISSLASIQRPNSEIILETAEILTLDAKHPEMYLSIGSLLNHFCSTFSNCSTGNQMLEILLFYESALGDCTVNSNGQRTQILLALKGLGNAGLALLPSTVKPLNRCILNNNAPVEIRAAAIDAFRRVNCDISRASLRTILSDSFEDAELRIVAYLQLMKCADYDVIAFVEQLLYNEEVNQVGSFIWTHLTNLQDSSNPLKFQIQSLLSNREFFEKFKSDFRKFSNNFEWSGYYEPLGFGGSTDTNIIYSQKSFVPRQFTTDFNADIYGMSFDILQVAARAEGLEKYIESFLREPSEKSGENSIAEKSILNLMRNTGRREEYLNAEPRITLSTKLLGEEFLFEEVPNLQTIFKTLKNLNKISIFELLKKGQEFSITQAKIPIDTSTYIFTSAGVPIKMGIKGSAVIDLTANMKLDLTQLSSGKAIVKFNLKPTVSLDVQMRISNIGYSSLNGVEISTSLSSSTLIDVNFDVDSFNKIEIDFHLPFDKIDLLKTTSHMSLIHYPQLINETFSLVVNEELVMNSAQPLRSQDECVSFNEIYGFRICFSTTTTGIPDLFQLLNFRSLIERPTEWNIELRKTEVSLKSFKFRYIFVNNNKELFLHILYDTPDTMLNRKHSLRFNILYNTLQAQLIYQSPTNSLNAAGSYIWKAENKRINASLIINDEEEGRINMGYKMYSKDGQSIVIPTCVIGRKNVEIFKVTGDLQARERKSSEEAMHYSVDLEFDFVADENGKGIIRGSVNNEQKDWEANLDVSYYKGSADNKETISVYYQRLKQSDENPLKILRSWRVVFSQFPNLNTKGKFAHKNFAGSTENSVQASFGADFANSVNQVDFYQNFIFYASNDQVTFNSTFAIKHPKNNLDLVIGLDLLHSPTDHSSGFIFQHTKDNAITSRFHMARKRGSSFNLDSSFFLNVPNMIDWRFQCNINELQFNTQQYQFVIDVSVSPVNSLKMSGIYIDSSTRLKALHELQMEVKVPYQDSIFSNTTLHYEYNQLKILSQATTADGKTYKVEYEHVKVVDENFAVNRKIDLNVFIQESIYYWHSELTVGDAFTMSNDIHIDRARDINFWIQLKNQDGQFSFLDTHLNWDANRDPDKQARFKIEIKENSLLIESSAALFGGEYGFDLNSRRKLDLQNGWINTWSNDHTGEFRWKNERRQIEKIVFGLSFDVDRSKWLSSEYADIETTPLAQVNVKSFVNTPFDGWEDNTLNVIYSRTKQEIISTLELKWHKDEFIKAQFHTGVFKSNIETNFESVLEILALADETMIVFKTGTILKKSDSFIDGRAFLQWDKDEIQLSFEVRNDDDHSQIKRLASAKMLTTIDGYKILSTFANLYAAADTFSVHTVAKWEETVYDVRYTGDLHTSKEYLKSELFVTTPYYGAKTIYFSVRCFHDTETHDEKLLIMGSWFEKSYTVNGRYSSNNERLAELEIKTPYAKFRKFFAKAELQYDEFYGIQAWMTLNDKKEYGVRLAANYDSPMSFYFVFDLKTPFEKVKVLKYQVKNELRFTRKIHVLAKIYAQYNDKKYGVGCIYSQEKELKLRVGLEFYSPFENLRELRFDISDWSNEERVRYKFDLQHGSNKKLLLNTDFMLGDRVFECDITSDLLLPLPSTNETKEVSFTLKTHFNWLSETEFLVSLSASSDDLKYEVSTEGMLHSDATGFAHGHFLTQNEDYSNTKYSMTYGLPSNSKKGTLGVKIFSGRLPVFVLHVDGYLYEFKMKFKTPWISYRDGHLEYELISQDVIKWNIVGSAALEKDQVRVDGFLHLNHNQDISKMDIRIASTIEDYTNVVLLAEGQPKGDGFRNFLTIETDSEKYSGNLTYAIKSYNDWKVESEVKNLDSDVPYVSKVQYKNVQDVPFVLSFELGTQNIRRGWYQASLDVQSLTKPYDVKITWNFDPKSTQTLPALVKSSGTVEISVENFDNKRTSGLSTLELEMEDLKIESTKISFDFEDKSSREKVDSAVFVEISSKHPDWDYILMTVNLTQITADPGLLNVYLVWPQLNPANFTATASYEQNDLRSNLTLDVVDKIYGAFGEITNKGSIIEINGDVQWTDVNEQSSQNVKVKNDITFVNNGFDINSVFFLPNDVSPVQSLRKNTMFLEYRKSGQLKTLQQDMEQSNSLSLVNSFLFEFEGNAAHRGPGIMLFKVKTEGGGIKSSVDGFYNMVPNKNSHGNVTITSSAFRLGNPLVLKFEKDIVEKGFRGNYTFSWPVWDVKVRNYVRQKVRATLDHRSLQNGLKGTLTVYHHFLRGEGLSFLYGYEVPKQDDRIYKFGINYKGILFEFKTYNVISKTSREMMKKFAFEFDNPLWPFGVAYLKTRSLFLEQSLENVDKLIFYDLFDQDRRTTFTFTKYFDEGAGIYSINGNIVGRKIELTIKYKINIDRFEAHCKMSWSTRESILLEILLKNDSERSDEVKYLANVKFEHPIRNSTLDFVYHRIYGQKFLITTVFDSHVNVKEPLKIKIDFNRGENTEVKTAYGIVHLSHWANGIVSLSHWSLEKDIEINLTYRFEPWTLLFLECLAVYSNDKNQDFSTSFLLQHSKNEPLYFLHRAHIKHLLSNLNGLSFAQIKSGPQIYQVEGQISFVSEEIGENFAKFDTIFDANDMSFKSLILDNSRSILEILAITSLDSDASNRYSTEIMSSTHPQLHSKAEFYLNPSKNAFEFKVSKTNLSQIFEVEEEDDFLSDDEDDISIFDTYQADGLMISGGYEDKRNLYFSFGHLIPFGVAPMQVVTENWVQDLDMSFKLNNSKFLNSNLVWRRNFKDEIKNAILEKIPDVRVIIGDFREWVRTTTKIFGKDASNKTKFVLKEIIYSSKPMMEFLRNDTKSRPKELVEVFDRIELTRSEKQLKHTLQFSIKNTAHTFSKMGFVKRIKESMAKGHLRNRIITIANKILEYIAKLRKRDKSLGDRLGPLKEALKKLADNLKMQIRATVAVIKENIVDFRMAVRAWYRRKLEQFYRGYRPHVKSTFDRIKAEAARIFSFGYALAQDAFATIRSWKFLQRISKIVKSINEAYADMSKRSVRENLEVFVDSGAEQSYKLVVSFKNKVFPFLDDWSSEVQTAWEKLKSYSVVRQFSTTSIWLFDLVRSTVSKLNVKDKMLSITAFWIENGYKITSDSTIKMRMAEIKSKSDMVWNPKLGNIKWSQKLPFTWSNFTASPNTEELFQIPLISGIRKVFFSNSGLKHFETWFRYFNVLINPHTLVPPFSSTGYLIGEDYIMSFDDKIIKYHGGCEYLLAADLIHEEWAVTVKYNKNAPKTVNVYVDGRNIEFSKFLKTKVNGRSVTVPLSLDSVRIWRTDAVTHLIHVPSKLRISWNVQHDVVSVKLPRTSFLNTAGVFGANNNEASDDFTSTNANFGASQADKFFNNWVVGNKICKYSEDKNLPITISESREHTICDRLYESINSPFKFCFHRVNPKPYHEMCEYYSHEYDQTSSSALAYKEKCKEEFIPVKLPVDYVQCDYLNRTNGLTYHLKEGETMTVGKRDLSKALDIVILIELKSCNQDLVTSKAFQRFINAFNEGLKREGILSTRYSVVVYGNKDLNKRPTVASFDSNIFTGPQNIYKLAQDLQFDNNFVDEVGDMGSAFDAMTYASNLPFRSPVKVAFMLFPCESCTEFQGIDYSTMLHILKNNAATLHVFNPKHIDTDKPSFYEKIIGYDDEKAFVLKDFKKIAVGDSAIKNLVKHPKRELGLCLPLSLVTKGSVYSTEFIQGAKKRTERYGIIVGRRTAENSGFDYDQRCLCLSTHDVTPILRCEIWQGGDASFLKRYGIMERNSTFSN